MLSEEQINTVLPLAFECSHLDLPGRDQGKVRDWYSLQNGKRLIITTDRLSAFDRVLACVPYKGQVLNQLSDWWFTVTEDIIANSRVSTPDPNAMVMEEVTPIPVEVIVRGYITGVTETALWYRYSLGEREIYGYTFEDGYRKNQQLAEPIVTPTTKGGPGKHDERLTCAEVVEQGLMDETSWKQVMTAALELFKRGQAICQQVGMILVDTKYEFGRRADGSVVLMDEVHTPDSSRFWLENTYTERFGVGDEPENFDKEFVRRYYAAHGYRGEGIPPEVPDDLWVQASQRYMDIYEKLTGSDFIPGDYPVEQRLVDNLRMKGIMS